MHSSYGRPSVETTDKNAVPVSGVLISGLDKRLRRTQCSMLCHVSKQGEKAGIALRPVHPLLLSDAQSVDQCTISLDISLLQIVKQTTSLTYHLQQTSSGVMIPRVAL